MRPFEDVSDAWREKKAPSGVENFLFQGWKCPPFFLPPLQHSKFTRKICPSSASAVPFGGDKKRLRRHLSGG